MKKILGKLIVVLIILIVFDKTFGYFFNKYIFVNSGSVNYFLSQKKDVSFIILGTSRAKHQIDPDLLTAIKGKGYNAGVEGVGEDLYNSSLLDIALNNNIKPQIVLLQTDAGNYLQQQNNKFSQELSSLYPYYDESMILHNYCNSLGYEERLKLDFEMYKFNGKLYEILFNFITKNSKVVTNNGYAPLNSTMDSTIESFSPPTGDTVNSFDETKLNALNDIIQLCNHNNIKLYFILPPTFNNYHYRKKDINRLISYIHTKSNEKIINMADIKKFPDLENAKNWKDENHLNEIGAAKFSQYLNDSLRID